MADHDARAAGVTTPKHSEVDNQQRTALTRGITLRPAFLFHQPEGIL